jgi:A/G-specific adenine glycosylase
MVKSNTKMRTNLLAWYARNKRAMPWRETRDAYRVWVSEVMLQQTRVAAVLPYYLRFVKRFPTVRSLARARSEDVLRLWAGLGYYSRARNMQRAAKEIVMRHGGKFPRDVNAALALPGVGRYTAAAVLSIAYGEALAVVDGNVARVLARLGGVRGDLRAGGRWKRLEERAQELMGRAKFEVRGLKFDTTQQQSLHGRTARSELRAGRRKQASALQETPGDWNQAMMELGATVCTPRAPRCDSCPLARWCEARRLGIVEKIPLARKKREAERVEIAAAVIVDARGRTLLVKPEKGETNGLFSGMWQFPILKTKKEEGRKRGREEGKFRVLKGEWVELDEVRHTVTFREVRVRPYLRRVEELPATNGARVVALEKVAGLAVSSATKKIAVRAMQKRGDTR